MSGCSEGWRRVSEQHHRKQLRKAEKLTGLMEELIEVGFDCELDLGFNDFISLTIKRRRKKAEDL